MRSVFRFRITPRTWLLLLLGGSLLLHGAALWLFEVRERHQPVAAADRPRVYLLDAAGTPSAEPAVRVLAEMFDPSLLAIPSERGFSRRLWQRQAAVTPPATVWSAQPRFLETQPQAAPAMLLPPPSLEATLRLGAEKADAALEWEQPDWEESPPATQSVWRMVGELAEWPRLYEPALPVLTNVVAVRATRLRIGVAEDGTVRFASVERSSGDEQADAQAVELVRRMRFVPRATAGLLWGVVRVLWAQPPAPSMEAATQ